MLDSLRKLWEIFDERKKLLVMKNQNGTFTNEQINKVLNWEVLNPMEEEYKPKDNTAINLSPRSLLELQWLKLSDLEWKRVVDIWAGFTWIPFLLDWIECEYNVVDPIFASDIYTEISRNKNKILKNIEDFDNVNYDLYKKWKYDEQKYYYNLNYEFNNILSDLREWESVDDYNFKNWDTEIKIHPLSVEKLTWIDNESVDIIFINHVITKNQVDPYKLLSKAYELLKKWAKIYITENGNFDFSRFQIENFDDFEVDIKKIDNQGGNRRTILILEKI